VAEPSTDRLEVGARRDQMRAVRVAPDPLSGVHIRHREGSDTAMASRGEGLRFLSRLCRTLSEEV